MVTQGSLSDAHGFAPVNLDDHRAWLWVVGLLSCTYSVLALAARITGKWGLLFWDDAVLGIGYVFAIVHWGLVYDAVSNGLGATASLIQQSALHRAAESYFASRIFGLLALCLSKASLVIFTRRIFSGDLFGEKIVFGVAYACIGVWGLIAVLLSSAGCHPDQVLIAEQNAVCSANSARWKVITALDVLTEVLIIVLPVWFISRNQIKASKKRIVVFVYSFRLFVVAFSIAAMASYFSFLHSNADSIGIGPTVAWQEVLLGVSLISASIPCLRSFLWAFMSRHAWMQYGNTTAGSHGGSAHMRSVQNGKSQNASGTGSQLDQEQPPPRSLSRLRPDWLEYKVDVKGDTRHKAKAQSGESQSVKSDGSEQMIIHRNVEFEVHDDRNSMSNMDSRRI